MVGAPGSPYRASSGTALNSAPKPSLSKELMQKLRSMTETIKMLSDENAQLRTQNEEILREKKEVMVRTGGTGNGNGRRPMGGSNGLYDDLDKTQLVELVLSYDEKLKALSSEVSELQKKLKAADEASREIEAASAASKSSAEKDKYKQLARRLKEERNSYRDSLDAKQKEQADLKVEMEKMSGLISELRVNCQTLQVNNFQKKSLFSPFFVEIFLRFGYSSFQGSTKVGRFLAKNRSTRRNLLYFVNRRIAEPSKIGLHFRKKIGTE